RVTLSPRWTGWCEMRTRGGSHREAVLWRCCAARNVWAPLKRASTPPTSHTSPQQPGRHSPWNSAPRFLRLGAAESQGSPPERVRSKPAVTTTTKKHSPAHRRQPSRVHPAVTRLAFIKPTGVRAIPPDDRRERSCAIAAALPLVVLSFMLFRAS